MKVFALVIVSVLVGAGGAVAGEPADPPPPGPSEELVLDAKRCVVFKDGFALVAKEATGRATPDGQVWTEAVPDAAILGSFWAVPHAGSGRLRSMDAGTERREWPQTQVVVDEAESLAGVLRMNPEAKVLLGLDDDSLVSGILRAVLGPPEREIVVVKTDRGDVTFPASRIQGMTLTEPRLRSEERLVPLPPRVETKKRLTFRFDEGDETKRLDLFYFRPGIRWIPTYALEIPAGEDPGEGRLILQAEILNEAEDLEDVPFDLVVGVPNFRFKSVVSPFVLERTLRQTLQAAAPQLMGQQSMLSNTLFQSRAGERVQPPPPGDAADVALPPDLEARSSQDLFVYRLPTLTLRKGHRKAVPIFDAPVRLTHGYRWAVDIQRHDVLLTPSGKGGVSPLVVSSQEVWHELELENATDVPWTTGPVMVLQDRRPMAQELLTYTPRRSRVRVPLTVAVDVRGSYDEQELSRTLDAMTWGHQKYARVDLEGCFTLRNFKPVPVTVQVTARVGGRAEEASDDGRIRVEPFRPADWKRYRGDPAVNNSSVVRYAIRLEAGQTRTATVRFHHFLRQ